MAKAEAEERLLEPAARGRQAAEALTRATEGRREKGRLVTEKLQLIARRIIKLEPEISLSRCARLVDVECSEDPAWAYRSDHKWITRHIRALFERRGQRLEYRPRRDLFVEGTTDG